MSNPTTRKKFTSQNVYQQQLRMRRTRIMMMVVIIVKYLFVCIYLSVAAQINYQRQQANISIAIRSPSTQHGNIHYIFLFVIPNRASLASVFAGFTSALPAMPIPTSPMPTASPSVPTASPPMPTASPPMLNASPQMPIPASSPSWGLMMTPGEVKELLAQQPQIGEYYVVTKGHRPGVYLSW